MVGAVNVPHRWSRDTRRRRGVRDEIFTRSTRAALRRARYRRRDARKQLFCEQPFRDLSGSMVHRPPLIADVSGGCMQMFLGSEYHSS